MRRFEAECIAFGGLIAHQPPMVAACPQAKQRLVCRVEC
jgi:hypothetical protein